MREVSLRVRLAAVVALVAVLCTLLMGVGGFYITRTRIEEVAGSAAIDVATLMAEDLQRLGFTPERLTADPELQKRASDELERQLKRLDETESFWTNASILLPVEDRWLVLARADLGDTGRDVRGRGETLQIIDQGEGTVPSLRKPLSGRFRTDRNEWFGASVPYGRAGPGGDAPAVMGMTMHHDDAVAYLREVRHFALGVLGAAIVLGVALGWWCSGLMLRPVDQVRAFAASLGRGEYGMHVEVRGAPEMRRLLEDMNRMATELSNAELRLHERTVRMAEMRDPKETGPHVKRVSGVSLELFEGWLARHPMGEREAAIARHRLRSAALLHDVGKVAIEDAVLKKPGKLDAAEYANMQHHGIIGAGKVLTGDDEQDKASREVALHHHERWDGKGYPGRADVASAHGELDALRALPIPATGLSGAEIPLFARIVAMADVFDALSSRRSYKEPWPEEKVLQTIRDEAGKAFDPELVEIFVERFDRVKAAWARHPDAHAAHG